MIKYKVTVDSNSNLHTVQKELEWGKGAGPFTIQPAPYSFNIPHGLALMEDKGQVNYSINEIDLLKTVFMAHHKSSLESG